VVHLVLSYGAAKDYAAGKFFYERGSVHRLYVGYASDVCSNQTSILELYENSYECLPLRPNNHKTTIEIHQGLSSQ